MLDNRSHDLDTLSAQAVDGRRLPTFRDLLRGCAMFLNDLEADAAAFAEETIGELDADDPSTHDVLFALAAMRIHPTCEEFVSAARELAAAARRHGSPVSEDDVTRCNFYAALRGARDSVLCVAGHAIRLAYRRDTSDADAAVYARAAVAWLLVMTPGLKLPKHWSQRSAAAFNLADGPSFEMARRMTLRMLEARKTLLEQEQPDPNVDASRSDLAGTLEWLVHPHDEGCA